MAADHLNPIAASFQIDGEALEIAPYGNGHINDTYRSIFTHRGASTSFIHQRINKSIFKQPQKLMANIETVTRHLRQKIIESGGNAERETLNLVPARDGKNHVVDENGDYWRTYLFIDRATTYDIVEDLKHVYNASRAFGQFQQRVSDIPAAEIHETIPGFHHTPSRLDYFKTSLERNAKNRARLAAKEIDFVQSRSGEVSRITDLMRTNEIPVRITHNDTKLNNVMIDDETGEAVCVIDLDTVMPGAAMYDFGDSIRIGAATAAEDEADLSKVHFDMAMFEQLASGYLNAARHFLNDKEKECLAFSAKLMTLECGMRFLSDFLDGDIYFKTHREGHNLDRCRTQLRMVEEMEARMGEMEGIIEKYGE